MSQRLEDAVGSAKLTPENAAFVINGDLPSLTKKESDGEEKYYEKVTLVRNFPFRYENEYITALDKDAKEIGIIINVDDFPPDQRDIIKNELKRRYFIPEIVAIHKIKEKMGFSSWKVTTDAGEMTFTVRDTYKNLVHIGNNKYALSDVDGNRYMISDLSKLDRDSYKKIEQVL